MNRSDDMRRAASLVIAISGSAALAATRRCDIRAGFVSETPGNIFVRIASIVRWFAIGLVVISGGFVAPVFSSPITVASGASEPTITAAPDGTLYVNGTGDAVLYRSTDHGITWAKLSVVTSGIGGVGASNNFHTSVSAVAMGPSGVLYVAFYNSSANASAVCNSSDRGSTWSCANSVTTGAVDRLWLYAPSGNSVFLLTNKNGGQKQYAVSSNGFEPFLTGIPLRSFSGWRNKRYMLQPKPAGKTCKDCHFSSAMS